MAEPLIRFEGVHFKYNPGTEREWAALQDISLDIYPGEFVAVLGHNGSGKSTLAKHCNGLLVPSSGRVLVAGLDTKDDAEIWQIRQTVGMVFQNPDNQLVATTVEEDVAFGPENLGIPSKEIQARVDEALRAVGMEAYPLALASSALWRPETASGYCRHDQHAAAVHRARRTDGDAGS